MTTLSKYFSQKTKSLYSHFWNKQTSFHIQRPAAAVQDKRCSNCSLLSKFPRCTLPTQHSKSIINDRVDLQHLETDTSNCLRKIDSPPPPIHVRANQQKKREKKNPSKALCEFLSLMAMGWSTGASRDGTELICQLSIMSRRLDSGSWNRCRRLLHDARDGKKREEKVSFEQGETTEWKRRAQQRHFSITAPHHVHFFSWTVYFLFFLNHSPSPFLLSLQFSLP